MRAKVAPLVLGLLAGLSLLLIATSCGEPDARDQSISFRDQNLALADAKFPLPILQNFPARGLLKEFTERQDLVNHPWFAYYMGENGNVVWYFVSETLPVNVCAFLSSTEDVRDDNDGNLILTAASLDGIFYGGAGASAACTSVIVKDAATGAIGTIPGDKLIVFDQPLLLEAEPIRLHIEPLP